MPHRAVAKFILTQRQALAHSIVTRQYDRQPDLRQRYGESGAAKCVQDTEYHLAYLAVAVMFSSPAILRDYICWVKTVLVVRNIHLEDVENNLVCLWTVLQEQLPEGSDVYVKPYIEDAFRGQPQQPSDLPTLLGDDDPITELARQYLQALLRAERHEASRLVREAFQAGVTITDLYLQVFQRCQREIGRLWQVNQVTVAQEHYCTAANQLVMAQLYPHLFSLPKNGRRLVATTVAAELHEVSLRIVTDLFEANGWNTVYLGANVPTQSVIQAIHQHRPDLLLISVTIACHLPTVEELIAFVRSASGDPTVKIMVGGYPFNVDPELWRRLGADGHARDASEALEVAACLLSVQKPSERERRNPGMPERLSEVHEASNASPSQSEPAFIDELSLLNNELLTAQRELAQKNAQLEQLNGQLVEASRRKDEFLTQLARDALLLANVRDSVIVTDLNGIVTYWNEGATRLFGWTAEEMIGRPYADRFPEPTRTFIRDQIQERVVGSEWDGEFEDYRKEGSRVWIDARVRQMTDEEGTVDPIV
jgi:PAS domain S-box-containing protein